MQLQIHITNSNIHTKIRSISVRTSLTMAPESEFDKMASSEHICIHGTSRAGWPSRTTYVQVTYVHIISSLYLNGWYKQLHALRIIVLCSNSLVKAQGECDYLLMLAALLILSLIIGSSVSVVIWRLIHICFALKVSFF